MAISTDVYFAQLPVELIENILEDLPLITFGNCQKICTLFHQIVNGANRVWEKWTNIVDRDNQWKPVYICKSLRDDFTWKLLVIDFKNAEKQTLKSLSNKANHPLLKNTLQQTQYHELTPFLHSDNAETVNLLGEAFLLAKGCSKHPPKAFEYFKQAANKKHADAQYNLGDCYEKGIGCQRDCTEAFRYYKLAADQGHKNAQYKVGDRYTPYCERDWTEVFRYYKLAAKQGHKDAQTKLGDCYIAALGCRRNKFKAFYYYKLAAKQGHKDAQIKLSGCYREGIGSHIDADKASYYYELATNQNSFDNDVKQQIDDKIERQTVEWISAKANHPILKKTLEKTQYHELAPFLNGQNPDILTLLGESFLWGKGCLKDAQKAIEYFKQAAKEKHARAEYCLGNCYDQGWGCSQDSAKSFHYYKLAADQGYAYAQYNLGVYYDEGKDWAKAFEYYTLAAEQGFAPAQYNLAIYYFEGKLCQQNLVKAFELFKLAADQGHPQAIEAIKKHAKLTQ